jgi:hypothetical protein
MKSNPPALRTTSGDVFPAGGSNANARLAPRFGESTFQAADLPTRSTRLCVHKFSAAQPVIRPHCAANSAGGFIYTSSFQVCPARRFFTVAAACDRRKTTAAKLMEPPLQLLLRPPKFFSSSR